MNKEIKLTKEQIKNRIDAKVVTLRSSLDTFFTYLYLFQNEDGELENIDNKELIRVIIDKTSTELLHSYEYLEELEKLIEKLG